MFVRWMGANRTEDEWVFAYKFDSISQSTVPAFPVTVATTETFLDMQASTGWVWERFTADTLNTTTPLKSGRIININVPDVPKLVVKLNANTVAQFTMDDLQGTIEDGTGAPTIGGFLHFCCFLLDKDGDPEILVASDIVLDVRCTQTVKTWKAQGSDEMIDGGDDV